MGELDNVGLFQVHFAEHSPQALETMIQSSWVTYLEAISCSFEDDILISASSRYDDTIAKKGNFIYDSLGRLLNISDMHKVLIPLNPDSLRRGETLRRLQELKQKVKKDKKIDFSYEHLEETEALLRKYQGKNLHELLQSADKTAKNAIKEDMKKLKGYLEELKEICLEKGLISTEDKNAKKGKSYMLFTYEQERLMQQLQTEKSMPINANKAIFHRKLRDFIKDYEGYFVFDPGNLSFELMAWDLMRMLRREYRNLPAQLRKEMFGVYPVTTVDIAYPKYKTAGWTSSGTKDRQDETKLLGAFQASFRRLFDEAGIKYDGNTLLVQVHTAQGRLLKEGVKKVLGEFKSSLEEYQPLTGHILIHLDEDVIKLSEDREIHLLQAIWLKDKDVLLVKEDDSIVKYTVNRNKQSPHYGKFVRGDTEEAAPRQLYAEKLHIYTEQVPVEPDYEVARLKEFTAKYQPVREFEEVDANNVKDRVDKFTEERINDKPQNSKDVVSAFKDNVKKGGVTFYDQTLKLYLPEEKSFKKLKEVFTDDCERGVKDPDDVRLFGVVKLDLDSHIGLYTHIRGTGITQNNKQKLTAILKSYVGRGWGIKDSQLIGTVLVDHTLKSPYPEFRLFLPILNTGYMDSLTSVIDTIALNSFIGVGSGIPLAIEGGRTAIVNAVLINAIIPEGRRIEPGRVVVGLMEEETKLVREIYRLPYEEAGEKIKDILRDKHNPGRFTSLAVVFLLLPSYRPWLEQIDAKDKQEIEKRMKVLAEVFSTYFNAIASGQLISLPGPSLEELELFTQLYNSGNNDMEKVYGEREIMLRLLGISGDYHSLEGLEDDYHPGLFTHGEKKSQPFWKNYFDYMLGVAEDELGYFAEVKVRKLIGELRKGNNNCLLYTSPSPRD